MTKILFREQVVSTFLMGDRGNYFFELVICCR